MNSTATSASKQFNKYEQRGAYHWDWYSTNKHNYQNNVNFVVDQFPTTGSVLDIGGGDGLISFKMFEKGLNVTCIDTNARSIQLARECFIKAIYGKQAWQRYPRRFLSRLGAMRTRLMERFETGSVQLLVHSAFEMPLASNTFDYVVCHEVIEHVPQPEELVRIIFNGMRRFAIISTPDITRRELHPLDYQGWTPDTFSVLLKDYTFEFIKNDGWNMYVKLYK